MNFILQSLILSPYFKIDIWCKLKEDISVLSGEKGIKQSYDLLNKHYKNLNFKFLEQTHGKKSLFINNDNYFKKKYFWGKADAAFSCRADIALGVKVADCIPILFFMKDGSFFGVIHAGWRGLKLKILDFTLEHIKKKFGSNNKSHIKFWVGPHIRENSYEVEEDVFLLFPSQFSKSFGDTKKKYLNLTKILRDQFMKCEINDSQIIWSSENTYNSDQYYSHRKKDIGRNIIIIHKK